MERKSMDQNTMDQNSRDQNTRDKTIEDELPWLLIDKYFNDNPNTFVAHHLESYNSFFKTGIKNIFKEKNPIRILKEEDDLTHEFHLKCDVYMGGKNGDKLYYGKPVIYDEDKEHYMYPNEARLRNMTYGITIHYDVEVDFFMMNALTKTYDVKTITFEKVFLGRFPIMLQSNLCILNGLAKKTRFELGECKNDSGGYFIIDGKEKCIISQEKFADNMIYIKDDVNDLYSHSVEIRSVSEDASKPVRTLAIKIVRPSTTLTNNQIVVNIPNVRKPVPLFILMRALGIQSDKQIIEYCLLDLEKYEAYIDLFIPSVHDAGRIFTQAVALEYIASFTKRRTVTSALEILTNYLLPHIGEMNFLNKAYFIGYMVKQLLSVAMKDSAPTDRDNFRFKRVELPGSLIYDLFKEYYTLQQREIFLKIDKEYFYKRKEGSDIYLKDFTLLLTQNSKEFFAERTVEKGFRKAFKGNWGAEEHTKRIGVVQDVNRLSYNSFMSLLRKISLPLDASAKIVQPRLLHASQWGIIDPIDTPDGGNVGLHKHLTILASITSGCSAYPMIQWLKENSTIFLLNETTPLAIANMCKVIVNGNWIGVIAEPKQLDSKFKAYRRLALLPTFVSIQWNIKSNTLFIYTDAGRLCRPIYYINKNGKPSYENKEGSASANATLLTRIMNNDFTWEQLITGFNNKKAEANFAIDAYKFYSPEELYNQDIVDLLPLCAIIDYMDTAEAEESLITFHPALLKAKSLYTHLEIHPSLLLGFMGNQVIFPENNQLPRDLFACGQAKQAVSLYHSNYQVRMDKMGVVLNNGQIPLIKSRYLKYINEEEHPCGENTIVAIMCLNGYNVEDSILFNEGALKRGLFRTTYFTTYESKEETEAKSSEEGGNNKRGAGGGGNRSSTTSYFSNIESKNAVRLKEGYDYSALDHYGLIKENTYVDEKTVLIGKVSDSPDDPEVVVDNSTFTKKGQEGYVDKTFMTEGEQGTRVAKVRIRNERIPNIGDKFSSRCGQKGTVGIVIPEQDMPFTAEGIRPDIIINPHAIPSRMTIGQLLETVMGKACSIYGAFGDCTAFINKGPKHQIFGELLQKEGYHSSGNEVLYNGQTGEQLEAQIFIGPTYYMRLKHMVKDKINYRAKGPRTALTRQTVQGRANDGGLRIGEMERDGLISHGITNFLQESMLVRGDDYYMAICNKTGTIAIYNSSNNLFISPLADGPLKFTETLDAENMNIANITRFGRSFSVIRVPYAFKLLYQELQTMNVQMRIITEDNIDQLAPMSFSNSKNNLKNVKMLYKGMRKYSKTMPASAAAAAAVAILPAKKVFNYIAVAEPSKLVYPPVSPQEYNPNSPYYSDDLVAAPKMPVDLKPVSPQEYSTEPQYYEDLVNNASNLMNNASTSVSNLYNNASTSASNLINNASTSASNLVNNASTSVSNLVNNASTSVSNLADDASSRAYDLTTSGAELAASSSARATTLAKAATDLASSLSDQAANISSTIANTAVEGINSAKALIIAEPQSLLTTIQPEKNETEQEGGNIGATKTIKI
jgi:DNA-directed RNA polymerase II subunit RPB2